MTRKVKMIFNPHSDRGRSWNMASALTPIIEQHGGASWSATEYPEHATELAEQAGREGYEVVTAIGGDGTVHEVVNGLMRLPEQERPALGAVPIGSGNDFCNNVGIQPDSALAMKRVFEGEPRRIDLGLVTAQDGRRAYWDNTLGLGFDANVTLYSYGITRLQGFSMYLWAVIKTIIRNHDAPRMKFTSDNETFEDEVLMFVACNGPREGGGFHVAPDAVPDDGLFHYAMIGHVSRAKMFRLIPEVMNGTHGRFKDVRLGAFKQLELTAERPFTMHLDGEIFAGFSSEITGLKIEILPRAIDVIV